MSLRPRKRSTALIPGEEAISVEMRCLTLLPQDDLVAVVREFINPNVSRPVLDRCLRCHAEAKLRELQAPGGWVFG